MRNTMNEANAPEETAKHPLDRNIRAPGGGLYFGGCLLFGCSGLIILIEAFMTGFWLKLGTPALMIMLGLLCIHAARKKERDHLTNQQQVTPGSSLR